MKPEVNRLCPGHVPLIVGLDWRCGVPGRFPVFYQNQGNPTPNPKPLGSKPPTLPPINMEHDKWSVYGENGPNQDPQVPAVPWQAQASLISQFKSPARSHTVLEVYIVELPAPRDLGAAPEAGQCPLGSASDAGRPVREWDLFGDAFEEKPT